MTGGLTRHGHRAMLTSPAMTYDPQNVFARILRGELPSERVYEDEHTIAFMDLMPQADGHTLVVPREAAETLLELSTASAEACIRTVKRLAPAVQRALNVPGLMIVQINGTAAGQTVPHVHFHIIPRRAGEPLRLHAAAVADRDELRRIAERIRSCIGTIED